MSIKGSHSNSVKGSKCFSYSIGPTASPGEFYVFETFCHQVDLAYNYSRFRDTTAPSYSPGHNSSKGKGKGIESGSYVTYPSGES